MIFPARLAPFPARLALISTGGMIIPVEIGASLVGSALISTGIALTLTETTTISTEKGACAVEKPLILMENVQTFIGESFCKSG